MYQSPLHRRKEKSVKTNLFNHDTIGDYVQSFLHATLRSKTKATTHKFEGKKKVHKITRFFKNLIKCVPEVYVKLRDKNPAYGTHQLS